MNPGKVALGISLLHLFHLSQNKNKFRGERGRLNRTQTPKIPIFQPLHVMLVVCEFLPVDSLNFSDFVAKYFLFFCCQILKHNFRTLTKKTDRKNNVDEVYWKRMWKKTEQQNIFSELVYIKYLKPQMHMFWHWIIQMHCLD